MLGDFTVRMKPIPRRPELKRAASRIAELEAEVAGLRAAIDREGIVVVNHPDPMQIQLAPAPGRKPFI